MRDDGEKRKPIEEERCAICLSPISERAVAAPCNHLTFDFICLVQWLQNSSKCPLCKTEVQEVQYDFRDVADFKSYTVCSRDSARTVGPDRSLRARSQPSASALDTCRERTGQGAASESPALTRRRLVYNQGLPCLHVGSNLLSGYQEYTPASFSASSELQSRARAFLRRELLVFDRILGPANVDRVQDHHQSPSTNCRQGKRKSRAPQATASYMVEYVVAVLRQHSAKAFDGRAEELVGEFIGMDNARLLLHEVDAWLRSPFKRVDEWDKAVQYPAVGGD